MKKILYLILIVPLLITAQNTSSEIYNSFENEENVNSFTFSKFMLDAIDMTSEDENGIIHHITGDLHKVKFLNFNGDNPENYKKLNRLFNNSIYKLVDVDTSDTEGVLVYIARKGRDISEVHLLIDDIGQGSLISIYGKLKSAELCAISNALNMNACNHFKYIK
jgi:hypothetical protein